MTDRPIIFSAPMVRALLDGRKTQTRRLYHGGKVHHQVGDRLYVREACLAEEFGDDCTDGVRYLADDEFVPIGNVPDASDRWLSLFHYGQKAGHRPTGLRGKGVPSIHMPRWASRLTLTVTDVRVQRVQEISEDDAIAEGIEARGAGPLWGWIDYLEANPYMTRHYADPRRSFETLWDSLHAEPGTRWEDDPWIYALTFTVEKRNIDA